MALTLATAKSYIKTHLQDASNLIFSDSTLEESIRSALRALNRIRDDTLTISGLDGASSTTVEAIDEQAIIEGGVAYSLTFRAVGLFEDPSPDEELAKYFSDLAQDRMNAFFSLLTQMELGILPGSGDDHLNALEIIAAEHANDLEVIAAKHANDQEIIAAENAREDAAKSAEQSRLDELQESVDHPYSQWDWDEGSGFL